MTTQEAADAYKRYLETFTPETLSRLDDYVAADVRFADPFNDVRGIEAMRHIFDDMFETIADVRFEVSHMGVNGDTALMAWTFGGDARGKPFVLEGMSRIDFDASGRVIAHIDHWDSATQFYMHIPVIGWLLSFVRRRVAAH